jgi:hypothetical protein
MSSRRSFALASTSKPIGPAILNKRCAWCGVQMGEFVPNVPTTSGICASCDARVIADAFDRRRASRGERPIAGNETTTLCAPIAQTDRGSASHKL